MARPRPVPSPLVEKNGSKNSRARTSSEIPEPRSSTVMDDAHTFGANVHRPDHAAARHRLPARVAQQIQKRLTELRFVEDRDLNIFRDVDIQDALRAFQFFFVKLYDVSHERRDVSSASMRGDGSRATRKYSSLNCSSRLHFACAIIAERRFFESELVSSSSRSSTFNPIDESGFLNFVRDVRRHFSDRGESARSKALLCRRARRRQPCARTSTRAPRSRHRLPELRAA